MSIAGLDENVPSDTAFAGLGDDEIRALKSALKNCFPNLEAVIEAGAGNGGANAAQFTQLFDDVATLLAGAGAGTIPVGGVIAYHGAVNAIPTGFALCDGTNGTPNLSDRFIYGETNSAYDSTVSPTVGGVTGSGTTGPSSVTSASISIPDHIITTDNLPEHRHKIFSSYDSPEASEDYPTPSTYVAVEAGGSGSFAYSMKRAAVTEPAPSLGLTSMENGVPSPTGLSHSAGTVDISHTHDLTGALPPYYKLAYIMYTG